MGSHSLHVLVRNLEHLAWGHLDLGAKGPGPLEKVVHVAEDASRAVLNEVDASCLDILTRETP